MTSRPLPPGETVSDDSPFAAIFAASLDAIIGMTPDGVITRWNPAAERIYGLAAREVVGQPIAAIIPDAVRAAESRLLQQVACGEFVAPYDTTRTGADGRPLLVSVSLAATRDYRGTLDGIVAIERDITQQRAVEAQLLQAKRMEGVGRVAAGVAQEFNNIHTAILGLVEFAEDEVGATSRARTDLREISHQALRGSRLARQLLGFSARQPHQDRPARVNTAVRELEPLLHRLAGERVWLTLDLSTGDALTAADESQLELIVFELVINACEAIGERGRVVISTQTRTIDQREAPVSGGVDTGRYFEIAVRHDAESTSIDRLRGDGGPDLFFSRKPDGSQFGLGLAMAYAMTQKLGGRITMSSLDNGGAVRVLLPLVVETPTTTTAAPIAREAADGDETILLVEDEAAVRDVIVRALRDRGYDVLEAKNGEDALLVAESHNGPIHLVVSDIVMPAMDGRALFDRMRSWYPRIRFLFISGYTRGALGSEQLAAEGTSFLAKPFTMNELAAEMRRLLDGAKDLRGAAPALA